ncbi:MAG: PTS system mannose/fructose/sorbose family transporter subunit IID [Aerococcus sp.]|nr:PTS system mannose/fructose/sorbose family transporter subunit IID [Aerococcus sp.]
MSENTATNRVTISKRDRMLVNWRLTFIQACWNYERMHNVGMAYTIMPVLKKLYPKKEDYTQALARHLEFFNCHPYLEAPIVGVVLAFEEEKANGTEIDDSTINSVKVGMMGPLAGVGDPIFWGTMRPVLGAFAASLALSQSMLGPLLFFVLWNVIRIAFVWGTQEFGYRSGESITDDLSGGLLQKITLGSSILGMFVMGVLVPRWTTMNFSVPISEVKNSTDAMVNFQDVVKAVNTNALSADNLRNLINQINDGKLINQTTVQTLGDVFTQILPGVMPLLLTFGCIYFLRKNVSPIKLILIIFVLGILMHALGIMS